MPRINMIPWASKIKGLFLSGPREQTPADTMRRLTGSHPILQRQLRTRNGHTLVLPAIAAAHSLFRFDDVRFQGATTVLFRNAVSIRTGLDGTPLEMTANNPRIGTDLEFLFVSGGGSLFKVDTTGADSNWGIAAPSTGPWGTEVGGSNIIQTVTAVTAPQRKRIIDDSATPNFNTNPVATDCSGRSCNTPNFLFVSDPESPTGTAVETIAAVTGGATGSRTIQFRIEFDTNFDLTTFDGGDPSPLEDFIQIFIKPIGLPNRLEWMEVIFRGGSNTLRIRVDANDNPNPVALDTGDEERVIDCSLSASEIDERIKRNTPLQFITFPDEYNRLLLPKKIFSDSNQNFPFDSVDFLKIKLRANWDNNFVGFRVADVALLGGGIDNSGVPSADSSGLIGDYKYRVTFRNSVTGNRSNPSPITAEALDVERGFVTLSSLPISADPQVDQREIWRTVGNGARFFKIATIPDNTTTTFDDTVADFCGYDSAEGALVMTSEELPVDNAVPAADFDQHIVNKLTSFWISNATGKTGRVFFSPVGRPESFKGFLEVSSAGDPLHRLVLYQGQRYVFSESKVFRIDGDDPYIAREIGGVPGIQFAQRRTVVPTSFGIVYQATDGIRIFDGLRSILINFDAVGPLFRGEAAENMTAFEGTVATFARGEYLISDGTQDLAINIENRAWREPGHTSVTSYFYEWDTDKIQAGFPDEVRLIEDEGVFTDGGIAIPFEWETPGIDLPNDQVVLVERIYSDFDTQSATVTPTLVHLDGTVALTTLSSASRAASITEVQRLVRKPSVRYTGSGTAQITMFDAELEHRTVVLGVRFPNGQRIEVAGRTTIIDTEINFIVDPPMRELEGEGFVPFIERLQLDINTGGNLVVPVILVAEDNEVVGTSVNTASRQTVEITVNRTNKVRGLRLEGDFTQNIQLFGAELTIRNVALGLVVL